MTKHESDEFIEGLREFAEQLARTDRTTLTTPPPNKVTDPADCQDYESIGGNNYRRFGGYSE